MKYIVFGLVTGIFLLSMSACKTAKHINKAITAKDTAAVVIPNQSSADSMAVINTAMKNLKSHYIDFKTFNAKIKVEYEDSKGKQPDITAVVRIVKDSAIWMSLSATFLNIEVYRVLITKDSVFLLNKQAKEVQLRSMDYLQDITAIPFDFQTLQNLLVGNPIFLEDKIVSYKKTESMILVSTIGKYFKHLLTLTPDRYLLTHSKLDDIDVSGNRTADITYSDFENKNGIDFSTYREITVSEKNKLDIRLNFKQYEFNKELSVSFNIPKNYKRN